MQGPPSPQRYQLVGETPLPTSVDDCGLHYLNTLLLSDRFDSSITTLSSIGLTIDGHLSRFYDSYRQKVVSLEISENSNSIIEGQGEVKIPPVPKHQVAQFGYFTELFDELKKSIVEDLIHTVDKKLSGDRSAFQVIKKKVYEQLTASRDSSALYRDSVDRSMSYRFSESIRLMKNEIHDDLVHQNEKLKLELEVLKSSYEALSFVQEDAAIQISEDDFKISLLNSNLISSLETATSLQENILSIKEHYDKQISKLKEKLRQKIKLDVQKTDNDGMNVENCHEKSDETNDIKHEAFYSYVDDKKNYVHFENNEKNEIMTEKTNLFISPIPDVNDLLAEIAQLKIDAKILFNSLELAKKWKFSTSLFQQKKKKVTMKKRKNNKNELMIIASSISEDGDEIRKSAYSLYFDQNYVLRTNSANEKRNTIKNHSINNRFFSSRNTESENSFLSDSSEDSHKLNLKNSFYKSFNNSTQNNGNKNNFSHRKKSLKYGICENNDFSLMCYHFDSLTSKIIEELSVNILDILNRFHIDINCVESIMRVIAQINEIIKKEDDEEKKEDDEEKKEGEGDDKEEINKNTNISDSQSVYVDISTQTDGTVDLLLATYLDGTKQAVLLAIRVLIFSLFVCFCLSVFLLSFLHFFLPSILPSFLLSFLPSF